MFDYRFVKPAIQSTKRRSQVLGTPGPETGCPQWLSQLLPSLSRKTSARYFQLDRFDFLTVSSNRLFINYPILRIYIT